MPKVSPARKAAFDVLMTVERGQAHSDDLLRGRAVNALSPADRNLATTLVLGVLRWQIRLDHQIRGLLKKPGARLDPEIRIALRLGAFQLLHLDRVPAHAAVDETVELAKGTGHSFAARMVNAVLRSLAADGTRVEFPETTAAAVALAQAHPAWMVERWSRVYGPEAARAICVHGQTQPPATVRLESSAVEAELVHAGIELAPGELLSAAHTVVNGDVASTNAFREGRMRFQDEGSQLIGEIAALARTAAGRETKTILDACAAPGGKTLILAERNPEARIVASEANPQRLAQLRKRLTPYGDRVECRLADASALSEEAQFDLVLADVPCSGTGTLGRNPEIRHRLRPEDLPRQAERQQAILRAALRAVRPGGCVVYSTCSLEPEENEQVVMAVRGENPNLQPVSLEASVEDLLMRGILRADCKRRLQECITPQGNLRLRPGIFKTDGFFIAMIRRAA